MDQHSHMEEELESIDLDDLDILGLEVACKNREYHKISPKQIDNLEVTLLRAQLIPSLGIQAGSSLDARKILKELRKRVQHRDLQ